MEVTESKLLSEILLQFHRRARNGYPFVTPYLTDFSHIKKKKKITDNFTDRMYCTFEKKILYIQMNLPQQNNRVFSN
jgi:hypothetical protein